MNVSRYIRREWEQVTCYAAAGALLVFSASWVFHDRVEDSRASSGRVVDEPPILGPNAFAFLQTAELDPASERNPFLSTAVTTPVAVRPEPRVRRAPDKAAPRPPAVAPKPVPTVQTPAAPQPPPSPVVAAAPRGPRVASFDVRYVFSTTNRSGRPVALIEISDPANPGTAPLARNVSAGDQVKGLRIQSFTDDSLILTDATGRKQEVGFGSVRRVAGELEPAP